MVLGLIAMFLPLLGLMALKYQDVKMTNTIDAQYMKGNRWCETRKRATETLGLFKMISGEHEEANVFFSSYRSRRAQKSDPLIIYFGDGPGLANSFQMIDKPGPCWQDETKKKGPNDNYWSLNSWANILYVDLPRTGFTTGNAFIGDREGVSDFMQKALHKFYKEFPDYRTKPVYIWGVGVGAQFAITFTKENHAKHGRPVPIRELILDSPLIDLTTQYEAAIDYAHENGLVKVITAEDRDLLKNEFDDNYKKWWTECSKKRENKCIKEMQEYEVSWKKLVDGHASLEPTKMDYKIDPRDILQPRRFYTIDERATILRNTTRAKKLNHKRWQGLLGVTGGNVNHELRSYRPLNADLDKLYWESGNAMRSSIEDLQFVLGSNTTAEQSPHTRLRVTIMTGGSNLFASPLGIERVIDKLHLPRKDDFRKTKPTPIFQWTIRSGDRHLDIRQIGSFRATPNLRFIELDRAGGTIGTSYPEYAALLPRYFNDREKYRTLPTKVNKKHKYKQVEKED